MPPADLGGRLPIGIESSVVAEPLGRVALFGGVYSNYYALVAAIADARSRGAERLYCLGDLGAFGPHPDRVFPVLIEHRVTTIQGNYDHSLGHRKQDCACGYTDPKDNHFARLSYEYTYAHTADRWKDWLRDLPPSLTIRVGEEQVLLCHGSPRRTNEFLWESTTPDPFLRRLFRQHPERAIACTHTGIHWQREVDDRLMVNVGVLGRPENNGSTKVGYCLLDADPSRASGLRAEYVDLAYDHTQLAEEMRAERLPEEFVETILTGWWTSCLEILPAKERAAGQR